MMVSAPSLNTTNSPGSGVFSHICDDCVSVVCGHKVLDLARRGYLEVVPADEMRSKIVLGSVGARGALSIPVDSVLCSSGHVV